MEKRKESLSALKLCRFCLTQNTSLGSLYDRHLLPKNSVDLPLKILSCVSIEVFPSDKMPSFICNHCKFFIDLFYKYKQICRQADENILQYIQNGTALESVPWPPSLIKAYQSSIEHEVVKTVVDGGATIQVSTQDASDSENEEQNVFNVTIADGSDDGSKGVSSIKVVASKDNQDCPKNVLKQDNKGFTSLTKLARHVRTHAGERPYPCKHCPKSFTKSHHYTRHLRLKHHENNHSARGPFGQSEQFRCEQCEDSFTTQDELIYHSAIHATQNLTCPLCQEKFENVDAVTTHIKSHVNGVEFMCDFCELVFTTKEKLESHLMQAHEDEFNNELGQDESSMEMDAEDDEDDSSINVKDEGDHMVIEIKKADDFMLHNTQEESEEKCDNTNSEDSEAEVTYTELSTVDTLAIIKKEQPPKTTVEKPLTNLTMANVTNIKPALAKNDLTANVQTASILRKAEEVKRKSFQAIEKKEKPNKKADSNNSVGASNKSLQLLEKELQELKRTNNSRNESNRPSVKSIEPIRNRRQQLHTSTPKMKAVEEKKTIIITKTPVNDKKTQDRRIITKENKEPKEIKEIKILNTSAKEDKEVKEKEQTPTPKSVIKNGNDDKNQTDEGIRRSTRPSKIKDYAKMIRDRSHPDEDDSDDADDEEYKADRPLERPKSRRSITKVQPKMIQTTLTAATLSKGPTTEVPAPRKRGRPRKEPPKEIPAKLKKAANETIEEATLNRTELEDSSIIKDLSAAEDKLDIESKTSKSTDSSDNSKASSNAEQVQTEKLMSPSGQTLKKVPIKALPPGVRPLPLPTTARAIGTGELCEMQIGKKMVKVQKIVMTKAEVEAMAKKGLVEMKDGTMVLKQGIKLPTSDTVSIKSSLVSERETVKESPSKKEKGAPSRCDLDDDL